MKVYFVRHGKTEAHERNVRQTTDSHLGEVGTAQAKSLAKRLAKEKIDRIFSSHWPRAHQTAQIVANEIDKEIEVNELLREQKSPKSTESLANDHELTLQYIKEALSDGRRDIDWKFRGEGESMREVITRAKQFRSMSLDSFDHPDETILVVSHGAFLSVLIPLLILGRDCEEERVWKTSFSFRRQENTGVTAMKYVAERDEWVLEYFNSYYHLF